MTGPGGQIYWGRGKGCRGWDIGGRGAGVLLRLWHVILEVLSLAVLPQTQIPSHCRVEDGKQSGDAALLRSQARWPLTPSILTELLLIFSSKGCQLTSTHTQALWLVSFFTMWPLRRSYTVRKARVEKGQPEDLQPSLISLPLRQPPLPQRNKAHIWGCI